MTSTRARPSFEATLEREEPHCRVAVTSITTATPRRLTFWVDAHVSPEAKTPLR